MKSATIEFSAPGLEAVAEKSEVSGCTGGETNMHPKKMSRMLTCCLLMAASVTAVAQEEAEPSRLLRGAYVAPMASYILTDDQAFDDGTGGTFALGYRKDGWAVEGSGVVDSFDAADNSKKIDVTGGTLNALLFPFKSLPNLFGLVGAGGLSVDRHPDNGKAFSLTTLEGGIGYIFPLSIGTYDFGIRADARYRYGDRQERVQPDPGDFDTARSYKDALFNLGLQLPLGLRPPPPPPPVVEPVVVIAPQPVCSDTLDNDGDGLIDFPADPGCTAADDSDETDPFACSDGKDNDGDGLIDFPADKGCTAAEDNDEVDPCRTPGPGERISLKGCGTGDIIVLRGVNFEFDKARLTVNAKTILDNVQEELTTYPEIEVELSGHTDAKGSDEYNQKLSERRAASVKSYLATKGIAKERMSTVGYGESKPVADNETDEGRELNRRTELKVTAGVAPGGPAASVADPAAPPRRTRLRRKKPPRRLKSSRGHWQITGS